MTTDLDALRGRAAALVRAGAPRPAVAADDRSLRDPRQRSHAPADAGRAGRAAVPGVDRAVADGGGARGRVARRGPGRVGGRGDNRRALAVHAAAAAVARDGWPADWRTSGASVRTPRPRSARCVRRAGRGDRHERAARRRAARPRAHRPGWCRPAAPPTGIRPRWSSARPSARRGRRGATRARSRGGARPPAVRRCAARRAGARRAERFDCGQPGAGAPSRARPGPQHTAAGPAPGRREPDQPALRPAGRRCGSRSRGGRHPERGPAGVRHSRTWTGITVVGSSTCIRASTIRTS